MVREQPASINTGTEVYGAAAGMHLTTGMRPGKALWMTKKRGMIIKG